MSENEMGIQEIIIDEELLRLLPPLDEHEYCSLESNILRFGCMNPLVLWNGILIDGHNRYSIVTKHNLPFNTISLEFSSREEAMAWMIRLQIDRRNLTPMQLTYFRGLHYNIEKKLHGDSDRFAQNLPSGQNVHLEGSTANRLSEQYRVTPRTIRRDGQIADVIIAIGKESTEVKNDILSGKSRISRKQLREMATASESDIAKTASEIAAGTFEDNRRSENPAVPEPGNAKTSDLTGNRSLAAAIIDGANELISNMTNLTRGDDPGIDKSEMKSTIRAFIDDLENIYKQID